ncbi:hypothetical protein [Cytobacillus oceanisediminis]|uniref:hypothetical protein n=1 Tax=Cytobacillus oceanisediminis TaxID=665099 RepID=UPI00254B09EC|nr:hypothetical protein [Cytobacillus oceanisediminis]MDK7669364.1 hypothetical protein [Cytobacillus oceanisediminis]
MITEVVPLASTDAIAAAVLSSKVNNELYSAVLTATPFESFLAESNAATVTLAFDTSVLSSV